MPFSGGVKSRRTTCALVCALAVLTANGLFGRPGVRNIRIDWCQ